MSGATNRVSFITRWPALIFLLDMGVGFLLQAIRKEERKAAFLFPLLCFFCVKLRTWTGPVRSLMTPLLRRTGNKDKELKSMAFSLAAYRLCICLATQASRIHMHASISASSTERSTRQLLYNGVTARVRTGSVTSKSERKKKLNENT